MAGSVVIIGAGIAGLMAGVHARAAGWRATVIEQAAQVGGRLRTEQHAGGAFDTGAQFFSVRDPLFGAAVEEWSRAGLIAHWCSGFAAVHPQTPENAPVAVEDGFPRYHIVGGMERLAAHLARDLEVSLGTPVLRVDAAGGQVAIQIQQAGAVATLRADAAILTPPVPASLALLAAGRQERALPPALVGELQRIRYAPCLCVSLDYPAAEGMALPPPGAIRLLSGPISWIASQRAKGLRRQGEGVVVHASPQWSQEHAHERSDVICQRLADEAATVLARWSVKSWNNPAAVALTRFAESLATSTISPAFLRADLGAPILFAGDAFGDRPRLEGAALSGLAAAQALCRG